MASIQKITNKKGTSYRVYIRNKGLPLINKTFSSKVKAKEFISAIDGNRQKHLQFGSRVNKLSFKAV